ncbi:hypothetical protein ACFVOK_20045 [Streptomyces sp. NPDC057798]|uniref:hypothetical protein n=1 Tax=Streptomyces sp. NPDC057798 TaxID=3346252 RepID=UPI0036BC6C1C
MSVHEDEAPVTVLDPEKPDAPPPAPAPALEPEAPRVPKDRRVLRAVLRWTAAVTVFAAVGAASAYGIARMERTDVPGLATASDGRWDYPTLTRPPLPSGSPGPFAEDNPAGTHHADLRALLLPAPEGATENKALRGDDGWLATEDFLAQFPDKAHRKELGQKLVDHGLRHIAARGWTTEDGTETRLYLLRFGTAAVVDELTPGGIAPYGGPAYPVRGDGTSGFDEKFAEIEKPPNVTRYAYAETKPYGARQVRHAYLTAGDVLALVVQSRKGEALAVPFRQTVTLQSQLLA